MSSKYLTVWKKSSKNCTIEIHNRYQFNFLSHCQTFKIKEENSKKAVILCRIAGHQQSAQFIIYISIQLISKTANTFPKQILIYLENCSVQSHIPEKIFYL